MVDEKEFSPWNEGYVWVLITSFMGVLGSFILIEMEHPVLAFLWAIWTFGRGARWMQHARNRYRGILVERRAATAVRDEFLGGGWIIKTDLPTETIGNIDIVLDAPSELCFWYRSFVVEVKAYKGLFVRRGVLKKIDRVIPPFGLEAQMRAQIKWFRQQTSRISTSVVWCPEASDRRSFWFSGFFVVNGPADFLKQEILRVMWDETVVLDVSFPRGQSDDVLEPLRSRGFRFFGSSNPFWRRRVTLRDASLIKDQIPSWSGATFKVYP